MPAVQGKLPGWCAHSSGVLRDAAGSSAAGCSELHFGRRTCAGFDLLLCCSRLFVLHNGNTARCGRALLRKLDIIMLFLLACA